VLANNPHMKFIHIKIHFNGESPEYSIVFLEQDRVVVHTHAYPLDVNE